jgi:predicted MFS family arabinose efflux permease
MKRPRAGLRQQGNDLTWMSCARLGAAHEKVLVTLGGLEAWGEKSGGNQCLSLFGITYGTVLPAFVDSVLGQGPAAFGAMNMASGIGAVSAAIVITFFGDRGHRGAWLSRLSLAYPLILFAFAFNVSYPIALRLSALLGFGFMGQFTLINTLLQTQIVDEMRGRVMSLYTLTFFGLTPFGNLAVGALSEVWGISVTLSASALLMVVFAMVILYRMPRVPQLA